MGNAASPDAKMFLDHVERFWTDQILGPGPIPSDGLLCGAPEPSCDRPPSGCSGQSRPFPYYLTLRSITPKYDGSEWPTTNQDLCKALALAQSWIMRQVPLEAQLYVGLSENSKTETTPCQKDVMKGVTVRKLKCTTGDCLGTPVLIVHIPASGGAKGNVLIYGHLDKQAVTPKDWTVPPGVCQKQRPFTPYLDAEKKRLYARGASDDGFAMFFAVAAVMALKNQGHACPTVNLIVDFDEEGGSANLPGYLETFQDVLKTPAPDLAISLDANVGDYESIWSTLSERTAVIGTLTVEMLTKAVHSGDGTRVAANPNRIVRMLIDRLEDPVSGALYPPQLTRTIPPEQWEIILEQARRLGYAYFENAYPWAGSAQAVSRDPVELFRNRSWEGGLAITGVDGLPPTMQANNVIVPKVSYELSLRLPPPVDAHEAQKVLKTLFEADPPYGAKVTYTPVGQGAGWVSPPMKPWLSNALNTASQSLFDNQKTFGRLGDGGTLPLLTTLENLFPGLAFIVTGVSGPGNNQHGPDENLNYEYAQKVAACIAYILSQLPKNVD